MNNFDKIIKQKAEQFEPPYNEAHWAELEGKLNASATTENLTRNLVAAASIIAIVTASVYFYDINNTNNTPTNTTEKSIKENPNTTLPSPNSNSQEPQPEVQQLILTENKTENTTTEIIEIDEPENKNEPIFIAPVNKEELENTKTTIVETVPSTEFIIFNNKVCLGETVSFQATENTIPVSYLWDFGDGSTSTLPTPKHVYKEDGKYNVRLTLTNKENGKEYEKTTTDAVSILALPAADFKWEEVALKQNGNKLKYPYIEYTTPKSTNVLYNWDLGDGTKSTTSNPLNLYKKEGSYNAKLTVKSVNGCTNHITKTIDISTSFDILAPNAFTPNNDGENETFMPKRLLAYDVQFEMVIKDKTGKMIYNTSDKNEAWNGSLNNNGTTLESGIYFWQVITYDYNGKAYPHYGKINLMK